MCSSHLLCPWIMSYYSQTYIACLLCVRSNESIWAFTDDWGVSIKEALLKKQLFKRLWAWDSRAHEGLVFSGRKDGVAQQGPTQSLLQLPLDLATIYSPLPSPPGIHPLNNCRLSVVEIKHMSSRSISPKIKWKQKMDSIRKFLEYFTHAHPLKEGFLKKNIFFT